MTISFFFSPSKTNREFYNIPVGGKIPGLTHFHPHEENKSWSNELSVSALYYTGELTDAVYRSTHAEHGEMFCFFFL